MKYEWSRRLREKNLSTRCKKSPDNHKYPKHCNTTQYCWTYGFCNHDSKEWWYKSEGNKDEAIRDKMIGRSKSNCSWWCESGICVDKDKLNKHYLCMPGNSQKIPSKPAIVMSKGDSGSSNNYLQPQDKYCPTNLVPDH